MRVTNKITLDAPFITDGGLETTLIYNHGIELRHFAAFEILNKPQYQDVVTNYYRQYLNLARDQKVNFMMISGTWRANPDWGKVLGYSEKALMQLNIDAIQQLKGIRNDLGSGVSKILISGSIGPRSDGYVATKQMNHQEALDYHFPQMDAFKMAGVDLVSAFTQNYTDEALGITLAAARIDMPIVISFTVETNGRLSSGEQLDEAINRIDEETDFYPSYYMINCAHPTHFINTLDGRADWTSRIQGIMANSSCKSHAELDEATELDRGNLDELASWYEVLQIKLPKLMVFGGCCGTDLDHIRAISKKIKYQTT